MKILMINSVCGIRSTGRICTDLAQEMEQQGHEVKIAYGREDVPQQYQKYAVRIGSDFDVKLHVLRTRLLDEHGFGSKRATEQFLQWSEKYKPDLLWLHNIHGYYINIEMLFSWIKEHPEMRVKWTLHDCWAFTGHCPYFTMIRCEQWKTHCSYCCQTRGYPASLFASNCKKNFDRKKNAFTGVKDMTLITPSQWLADLVKQSFLKKYPVKVLYNKIDTNVFKPTLSDFRERYELEDKKVILGVASVWNERKGLGDFIRLAHMLDDSYAIVLVGITQKQMKSLSKEIKGLKRTDIRRLAAIYSVEDVYVNPSEEESIEIANPATVMYGRKSIVYCETAYKDTIWVDECIAVPENINALYDAIVSCDWKKKELENAEKTGVHCKIICIPSTNNSLELAEIYTAADIFVNPTHEDNYPTVNLEAMACGTKVVTYQVGGSEETLKQGGFTKTEL